MSVSEESSLGLEGMGTSGKSLFTALMDQSPDHIYIKDTESRFIEVSRTMAEAFHLEDEGDAIGKTDFDFFTEEHATEAYNDEQEILKTGVPMINKLEKETWENGSVSWVSTTKAPIILNSGKIVGLIGISRDVTAQYKAQEALKQSERKLKERDLRISKDLASARHVQQVFIPGVIPKVDGFRIDLRLIPMDEVGGDIITFPATPESGQLFFIGDVTGHGVTAALFTMLVKYLTDREGENFDGSTRRFLKRLNTDLEGRIPDGFVVGVCGQLKKNDHGAVLCASNAGHPEFIHYRAKTRDAEMIKLPRGNVLGLPLEAGSEEVCYELESHDRILFFTDGITETRNAAGQEFGLENTTKTLAELGDEPFDKVADLLIEAAKEFGDGNDTTDDLSLLLIEVE